MVNNNFYEEELGAPPNYDFLIIGGGIVGLSTAVQIQKSGKSVLVLEKEKKIGKIEKFLIRKDEVEIGRAHV